MRVRLPASRQFDLFIDSDDYEALASEIAAVGGVVSAGKRSTPVVAPVGVETWRPAARLVTLPEALAGRVSRRDPHHRGTWILTPGIDPVVELWLSPRQADRIRPGRLYFNPLKASRGLYVLAPAELQEFTESLFVRVKKWSVTWNGHRCGPATATKLETGAIHL